MQRVTALLALAGICSGSPIGWLLNRQSASSYTISNEVEDGVCKQVTFIMARASTEPGNMGISTGPATCAGLKALIGAQDVACQGVGSPYTAALGDNSLPNGTTSAAIGEAQRLIQLAASKCPQTSITIGGYSQGAAVMHAAVHYLPEDIKPRIQGAVMFGDTRNRQDNGTIPAFYKDRTKIFCNSGDTVCNGTLTVTAAHLNYIPDVDAAVEFLQMRITAGGGFMGNGTAAQGNADGLISKFKLSDARKAAGKTS